MTAIAIENLAKSYGHIRALTGVSFEIEKGEVIGLLGPNGAGKTTLMKILTGYLEPDSGSAKVHGVDVVDDPIGAQRRIGYLPESAPVYREMLVQEYLETMAALREVPLDQRRKKVIAAIEATGLEGRCTQQIGTLSKGYKQRVGIAQAILHSPDILILDEPTTGLDPAQIVEIRDLIKRLAEHSTVLLSTHILSEVEATAQRVLVIMNGKLLANANLDELRDQNAAIVAIEKSATGVEQVLKSIEHVTRVERVGEQGEFERWRLSSSDDADLCPAVFDALRSKTWRVGELRNDPKTLEAVFRDLASKQVSS